MSTCLKMERRRAVTSSVTGLDRRLPGVIDASPARRFQPRGAHDLPHSRRVHYGLGPSSSLALAEISASKRWLTSTSILATVSQD